MHQRKRNYVDHGKMEFNNIAEITTRTYYYYYYYYYDDDDDDDYLL